MSNKWKSKKRGVIAVMLLVKKAQKGNDKAFLKLFQQHEEDIYRMAYVYVKNKDDALDVVQEVAYQSFKKISTLKKPEYFKTWLMRITINCAINIVNKNKKVVHLNADYDKFIGTNDEDIPLSLSLQELIDMLTEDEKSIVLLRFYHNHSFKEIAELLNIPLGTAKSTLYRALHKLRKEYKEGDICGK
ncbi:sigma-70 family RNA polymerase sigma factor [Mesobacillus zeae]|uniref:Sigma-70 family RNA polymerase sigma factor n=1 Tax=Mesobacillus zeae TaxID=1917180 RepID=A0A398AZD5_9BACI|nr:sigma-70 family RNA polymerase sigma factor [Mesobacillus zeae]RID82912.1 sigma-70 family RNA polymerase sigma factor [Mesobacillus zeae]